MKNYISIIRSLLLLVISIIFIVANTATGSVLFSERWESAPMDIYVPSDLSLISADEGYWFLGDTVSEFPECGTTPHKAEIFMYDGSNALRLTSGESGTGGCADNVWVSLFDTSLISSLNYNKGFSIPLANPTYISFKEEGELINPQEHGWGRNCIDPPCFDNISMLLEDNHGNILAYVLQRYPDAVSRYNSLYGDTYGEIFLDSDAETYSRNLFEDFSTIPAFDPTGAQVLSIEFKVSEHGWAIIDNIVIDTEPTEEPPISDIKANNSDGPITITPSDTLSVNVSLAAGSSLGVSCDWWVVAETPFGWYYFDASTMSWAYAGDSYTDLSPTYQGSLFDLSPFVVLYMSGLPAGTYTFYFAVDTNRNGILDFGELFFDSVVVNITP